MWTRGREPIEDPPGSGRMLALETLRSDDGALLVYQGSSRERVDTLDYRRGNVSLHLQGSHCDGNLDPTSTYTIYLEHVLRMFRLEHGDQPEPTAAEIARLKADLEEAIPAWGSFLAEQPITRTVFT